MNLKVKNETCQACRFWNGATPDGTGECRRHAPQVVALTYGETEGSCGEYWHRVNSHTEAVFPETKGLDWCGDFEFGNNSFD